MKKSKISYQKELEELKRTFSENKGNINVNDQNKYIDSNKK
jgi:hypothetical protein